MKTNCGMCLHYYRIIATQRGYNPYPCCHLIEDTGESPHPLTRECFTKRKLIRRTNHESVCRNDPTP